MVSQNAIVAAGLAAQSKNRHSPRMHRDRSEATRQDYLHEAEHMRERVALLEQAIKETSNRHRHVTTGHLQALPVSQTSQLLAVLFRKLKALSSDYSRLVDDTEVPYLMLETFMKISTLQVPPPILLVHNAERRMGCSARTVRRLIQEGRILAHRQGRRAWAINATDLDYFLARRSSW
jgi:excisionase family DNA binding protein